MKSNGITPDVRVYTDLIVACGKSGEWRRGFEILEEMRGHSKSSVEDSDDEDAARTVLRREKQATRNSPRPDRIAYNALFSAIERSGGGSNTALRLLAEMKADGLEPDAYTYNSLVRLSVTDPTMSDAVLDEMLRDGRCDHLLPRLLRAARRENNRSFFG